MATLALRRQLESPVLARFGTQRLPRRAAARTHSRSHFVTRFNTLRFYQCLGLGELDFLHMSSAAHAVERAACPSGTSSANTADAEQAARDTAAAHRSREPAPGMYCIVRTRGVDSLPVCRNLPCTVEAAWRTQTQITSRCERVAGSALPALPFCVCARACVY